jgi:spore coat protein U-like protein
MNGPSLRSISLAGIAIALLVPDLAHAINCRVTLVAMNFGIYTPLTTTHVDVMGQVNLRCQAQPGSFTVTISTGVSGDHTLRTMLSATADILNYNLYRDASRTQIWGDGSPPTFTVSGVRPNRGRPTTYNYPIYGRVFANQAPNAGIYNDDPLVTVLF